MKKQNTNNSLAFKKVAVTELNEQQLDLVNGGTGTYALCDAVISYIVVKGYDTWLQVL